MYCSILVFIASASMEVPLEILIAIASQLNIEDLSSFRLINRQCANAGLSLIPQNRLSVIDTIECLENFKAFLQCESIRNNTKKITFVYGKWPVCRSRKAWACHPLLFRGNDRSNATRLHSTDYIVANLAFKNYSKFLKRELARRYYNDVADIFDILSALPVL